MASERVRQRIRDIDRIAERNIVMCEHRGIEPALNDTWTRYTAGTLLDMIRAARKRGEASDRKLREWCEGKGCEGWF